MVGPTGARTRRSARREALTLVITAHFNLKLTQFGIRATVKSYPEFTVSHLSFLPFSELSSCVPPPQSSDMTAPQQKE